jgi:hypothetical protein
MEDQYGQFEPGRPKMKNEKTLGSIAISEVNTALEPMWRSVIPLFRGGTVGQPEAFGSAVLLELGGRRFLVTDRHVVDEHSKSTIHAAGALGFVPVTGEFFCTPEAESDVAVLRLEGDLLHELANQVFLSEADIFPADEYNGVNHLTLVGYPASRSKENRLTRGVRTQCYSLGVRLLSLVGATLRGSFLRTRQRDGASGLKVTAPEPYGMSGGAMFASKVKAGNADGNHEPKLAGISTTWLEDENEVIGTKIAIVLAIIRDAYGVPIPEALAPARVTAVLNPVQLADLPTGHAPSTPES